MISVGFPRKIAINEDSQKFSYFYFFNIVNFYFKVKVWFIIMLIFKYQEISFVYI